MNFPVKIEIEIYSVVHKMEINILLQIVESFRLEKTLKTIESNHKYNTAKSIMFLSMSLKYL